MTKKTDKTQEEQISEMAEKFAEVIPQALEALSALFPMEYSLEYSNVEIQAGDDGINVKVEIKNLHWSRRACGPAFCAPDPILSGDDIH